MSNGRLFDEDLAPGSGPVKTREGAVSGAPRLMTADRRQVQMKAVDLESLLPPEHLARVMWAIVEKMDLSAFYDQIAARGSEPGRSTLDPKVLVVLWLYATSQGEGSAREVARLCKQSDPYRWICGGLTPNHHRLSDFRVQNEQAVDDLMTQLLGVMLQQKLVVIKRTAQDGMRVRAHAGAASFRREKSLRACLEKAREHVERVKKLTDDPSVKAKKRAAQERAAREQQERIERALAELPKARASSSKKPEEVRASTTDAQARVMKMGDGGFRPAYNVQLSTDTESRVIVGVGVTNAGADAGQLAPMLDEMKERTGTRPKEHLVDGGFVNCDSIAKAANDGITVYAPVPTPRKEGIDPHAPKPDDKPAVASWRERMATDEAKEIYKQRAATAETVNADLKQWRGLTRFSVRGLTKVTTVVLWAALTYNLMRGLVLGMVI